VLAAAATLALAMVLPGLGAAGAPLAVPKNVNLTHDSGNQSEDAVAFQQTNPNNVVMVSNEGEKSGMAHAWSTDGGRTWQSDIIADGDNLGEACCDPALTSDEFGNIFLAWLSSSIVVRVAVSSDGGATFQSVASLGTAGSGPIGAPNRALGRLPGGDQPSITATQGMVWITYTGSSSIVAQGAAVTGLGQVGTFSSPEAPSSGHRTGDYGDVAIGPGGRVVIAYQDPTGGEGPATIYFATDPDGLGAQGMGAGVAIQTTNVGGFDYIPAQAGRSVDAETELQWDHSGGAHDGRLYLLFTSEQPNESNDMDIQVKFSDDNGTTWSNPVRVNDDTTTNSQFNPKFALDQTTGTLAVGWYDCRNDLGDHGKGDTDGVPNDDAMAYMASSSDGGVTFSANRRLAKGVSNSADANNGIDYGDYEGAAFQSGTFLYVWSDNSNSTGDNPDGHLHQLDIYTAPVRIH
jgi:hypothetical protein